MDAITLLQKFGLAIGLGLLVGLQRERSASKLAGFRTFPLVTMFGALAGYLSISLGWGVAAAGLLAVAALLVIGNVAKLRSEEVDPGLTTEVAMLAMFCLGVFLIHGPASVAVVLGGMVALLLYLKPQLHGFAARIGQKDFRAMMQFVAIALVILPVLPDANFGPYQVFNPHRMWWLVVLITGISLAGYVLYKLCPPQTGAVVGGLLGGLISSTATTVSYARRTRDAAGSENTAALIILLAGAVVFIRVLVSLAAVAQDQWLAVAPPLGVMLGVMFLLAGVLWWRVRGEKTTLPEQANPTNLGAALIFAGLYAVVLLAVAVARDFFGSSGLYVVAALSGLTDMDAITLSTAQLVHGGQIPAGTGWRLILTASLANIVFKTVMVGALGSVALLKRVALFFGLGLAAGGALLIFWPQD